MLRLKLNHVSKRGYRHQCPSRCQDISSNNIDYVEYVLRFLFYLRKDLKYLCCRRNDIKCKYMSMFPLKNVAHKGLNWVVLEMKHTHVKVQINYCKWFAQFHQVNAWSLAHVMASLFLRIRIMPFIFFLSCYWCDVMPFSHVVDGGNTCVLQSAPMAQDGPPLYALCHKELGILTHWPLWDLIEILDK